MVPLLIARSIYHNSIVLIQLLLLVQAGLPRQNVKILLRFCAVENFSFFVQVSREQQRISQSAPQYQCRHITTHCVYAWWIELIWFY
jgi:hypothetical protein